MGTQVSLNFIATRLVGGTSRRCLSLMEVSHANAYRSRQHAECSTGATLLEPTHKFWAKRVRGAGHELSSYFVDLVTALLCVV
jgi:hypothetical protein